MTIKEYIKEADLFAAYKEVDYIYFGLAFELGELGGKITKYAFRGDELSKEAIEGEVGDCFWFLSQISKEIDFDLQHRTGKSFINPTQILQDILFLQQEIAVNRHNIPMLILNLKKTMELLTGIINFYELKSVTEIMQKNIDKLSDRKKRNVILGSGDKR